MANPLADALMSSITAGMDPMNGIVRQYAQMSISTQQEELELLKLSTIETIEQKLAAATEKKAAPSVIQAYEKMLARAWSRI